MNAHNAATHGRAHTKQQLGAQGEQIACDYLEALGYRILRRNWWSAHGELDLIAERGDTVVAVEVKTRSDELYGSPLAAITPTKMRRIRRLFGTWMRAQPSRWRHCRVDAIGVTLRERARPKIEHIEGLR